MVKEKGRKQHFFYVDVAEQIGVIPALLLEYFRYWVHNNSIYRAEETYKDGKYWTYGSVAYIKQRFPYLTVKQVQTGISKLISEGLIETGNYNKKAYDRTKWYTLTEKANLILSEEDPESDDYLIKDNNDTKNNKKREYERAF